MADDLEFTFETLSKAEALERKQPRLAPFDPTFWDRCHAYLQTLESSVRREQERNPSSRKIALLQDELRNANRKVESVWEARERKLTLQALKNSRFEGAPAPENSTKAEQVLYLELAQAFRKHVPRLIQGLEKPSDVVARPPQHPWVPPAPSPAAVTSAPSPSVPPTGTKSSSELVTVRALMDVPPFMGLDGKTYKLKKGDVLTLPRPMVELLAKKGHVAVVA